MTLPPDPRGPEPERVYVPGTCVLTHRYEPERLRRAEDGGYVCYGCRTKTLRHLRQLAPLHRLLGEVVAVATAAPRAGSRNAEAPIPLHDAAATHRRHIRQHLDGWAQIVAEQRGLHPPDLGYDPDGAGDRLPAWLAPHHDWLLYEDPGGYATDLGELHSRAWTLAYPSGKTRREFARCPDPACVGTLIAWLAPGDLLPAELTCDACGTPVPPAVWLTGRQTATWLTAVELSVLWQIPVGTVQYWASVDKWPRVAGYPVHYDPAAAQVTHGKRRVPLAR